MSTIIVTNPDVDGVLAASIIRAAVTARWDDDGVRFANYQDLQRTLGIVLGAADVDQVYLVDLGVEQIPRATFDQLVAKACVHLVDHHTLSAVRRRQIEDSGGSCWRPKPDRQACSTELAIEAIGQSTAGPLAVMAAAGRADDFGDQTVSEAARMLAGELGRALMPGSTLTATMVVERLIAEIRDALASVPPRALALSSDLMPWLRTAAQAVEAKQREALSLLRVESVGVESRGFGKVKLACARVPDILFGKPAVEAVLAKYPEAHLANAFFDDGACWVFPRGFPRGELDLLPFLQALGGGGRDGGGGFGFRGPTNNQNYRERLDGLLGAMAAFGDTVAFAAALATIAALESAPDA